MKFEVMAGGRGTKLWPASRDEAPKQFQKIIGDKTLFQLNVEGLLEKYKPEDIFISTNEDYVKYVKEQTPQLLEENYIIEPKLRKDTGPASGYAMLKVAHKYPDEVIMFYVQPVVVRTPNRKYLEMIEGIEQLVLRDGKLVTGGQIPRYAETGSDYLQLGHTVDAINDLDVHQIERFIDRPKTQEEADELISKVKISTHCNHYTWTADKLMDAFKELKPEWFDVLMEIKKVLGQEDEYEQVKEIYAKFEPGRIEELTKHLFDSQRAQIVILPFKWTHITTWRDVYEYSILEDIDPLQANVIDIDSKRILVKGGKKKLIATVGLEDIVIVDSDDILLVCSQKASNRVKEILGILEEKGLDHYI